MPEGCSALPPALGSPPSTPRGVAFGPLPPRQCRTSSRDARIKPPIVRRYAGRSVETLPKRQEVGVKVLIVLTSHDKLGNTGRKTGFSIEQHAAPYYEFKDAGAEIVLASPKGGQPPLDPTSNEPDRGDWTWRPQPLGRHDVDPLVRVCRYSPRDRCVSTADHPPHS